MSDTDTEAYVPIRSCIGCRGRAPAAALLRVVVAPDGADDAGERSSTVPAVVPDPHRRMPGRGAWLHRDPGCVELAVRRRAFARALHVPGALDPAAVAGFVEEHYGDRQGDAAPAHVADNRPQES